MDTVEKYVITGLGVCFRTGTPDAAGRTGDQYGFFIHKKNSSTYDLYVDGKYLTTLDHIPEEMTDFQIKEQ